MDGGGVDERTPVPRHVVGVPMYLREERKCGLEKIPGPPSFDGIGFTVLFSPVLRLRRDTTPIVNKIVRMGVVKIATGQIGVPEVQNDVSGRDDTPPL